MRLGLPAELALAIVEEAEYYPVVRGERRGAQRILRALQDCPQGGNCAAQLCVLTPVILGGTPRERCKIKRVTWTIESHDQGWGGEVPGTYRSAFSWYEATIVRPRSTAVKDGLADGTVRPEDIMHWKYCSPRDARGDLAVIGLSLVPVPDTDPESFVWLVKRNRVARSHFVRYRIEWSAGENLDPAEAEGAGCGTGVGFIESLRPGDRIGLWMCAQYNGWANFVKAASVEVMYDVY
ncbi:hypothetical protein GY45DRAFT_1433008 [Cubamyces sp. BRFM 1775]|nr:hypothetical protein GY45DRAFT_1433008 [Cubamyces sp. BRFM 1775]